MLIEANWGNFRAKFNGREQKAFEWMCSLLFYKEHGRSTGALRYFNQPGIEAEPVTVGDQTIGFQAKFIGSDLVGQKKELIRAIDTAKSQHLALTDIYFYINVDFGRGRKSSLADPTYKAEIDAHAKKQGIAISWRTAAFFETPFVAEINANIAAHFFKSSQSIIDFVGDVARHTDAMLAPIHSQIIFNGKTIKIDRRAVASSLKETLKDASVVIVSGEAVPSTEMLTRRAVIFALPPITSFRCPN